MVCVFLQFLVLKCASRHNGVYLFDISSQRLRVVRAWCVFHIFTSKWGWRHNGVHFLNLSTSKRCSEPVLFFCFTILTSKSPSRHNSMHFVDTSISKSAPSLKRFAHFDFEMCFAPQHLSFFRHLNFQKCSDTRLAKLAPWAVQVGRRMYKEHVAVETGR